MNYLIPTTIKCFHCDTDIFAIDTTETVEDNTIWSHMLDNGCDNPSPFTTPGQLWQHNFSGCVYKVLTDWDSNGYLITESEGHDFKESSIFFLHAHPVVMVEFS